MGVIYERRVLDLEQKVKDLTECCHGMLDLIDELWVGNEAFEAALEGNVGNEKLIDVMKRRYGREAGQWKANHAQRKQELAALKVSRES